MNEEIIERREERGRRDRELNSLEEVGPGPTPNRGRNQVINEKTKFCFVWVILKYT